MFEWLSLSSGCDSQLKNKINLEFHYAIKNKILRIFILTQFHLIEVIPCEVSSILLSVWPLVPHVIGRL